MSKNKENPELYEKLLGDDEEQAVVGRPVVVTEVKNARGCRGAGGCLCKCVLITLALFTILGFIAAGCSYYWMKDVVEHLTVETPLEPLPVVDMTDAELEIVKDRVKLFVDELRAPGHAPPDHNLVITQDEINGFIGHSDYLRGNMFVTVQPNVIKEKYSLPVEMLPGGKGRYFVGSDYLKLQDDGQIEVEMETAATHQDWFDGPLLFAKLQYLIEKHDDGKSMMELFLEEGQFFGQEASQEFIDRKENLLEDLYDDPDNGDARAVLEGIERVIVDAGKIVIVPRKHNKIN